MSGENIRATMAERDRRTDETQAKKKFRVHLQQFVEEIGTIEVEAVDEDEACAIAKRDAHKAAWEWPRWESHDYAALTVGTLFILPALILIAFCVRAVLRDMHRGLEDPHAEPHGDVPHTRAIDEETTP